MPNVGSRILSGSTEVATAGTAVQLIPATSANATSGALGVWIGPDSGNAGIIVVGGSTIKAAAKSQNGLVLAATAAPIFLPISDVTSIWVDAITSKDKLSWLVVYQ